MIGTIVGSIAVGRPTDTFGRRDRVDRDRRAVFCFVLGQRISLGIGPPSCSSGLSAVWPSAALRWSRPCTSPRFRRPPAADGSWPSRNSTLSWAPCWLSSRTTDRPDESWRERVAVDVRRGGDPVGGLLFPAVPHAQQPALAHGPRADRRGPRMCSAVWRGRRRRRAARDSGLARHAHTTACGSPSFARPICGRSCWPWPSRSSISFRASTP